MLHKHGYPNQDSNQNKYTVQHKHGYSDQNSNKDSDAVQYWHFDPNAYGDKNSYANKNLYPNKDADCHSDWTDILFVDQ